VRFFFDQNLAPKLARGFHQFVVGAHEVVHLRDRFTPETRDADWMEALAKESGWIILSGDLAIRRNPHQLAGWRAAGQPIFFLEAGWTNLTCWQQVQRLARSFSAIIDRAQSAKPGDAFLVTVNGRIVNI
jgi:hypothetical protein